MQYEAAANHFLETRLCWQVKSGEDYVNEGRSLVVFSFSVSHINRSKFISTVNLLLTTIAALTVIEYKPVKTLQLTATVMRHGQIMSSMDVTVVLL